MWSSVVESCGHGAVHWFRDWSLITGRGATHCLYGFVDLHKMFLATVHDDGIKLEMPIRLNFH